MTDTLRRNEHGKVLGLDWAAISPSPGAVTTLPAQKPAPSRPRPPSRPSRARKAAPGGGRGGPAQGFDRDQIRELYLSGLSSRQVAMKVGSSVSTISRLVRVMGIVRTGDQGKGGGPARKTHCIRNHEFTAENTRELKGGGRSCKECERIRGRVGHKRDGAEAVRGVNVA